MYTTSRIRRLLAHARSIRGMLLAVAAIAGLLAIPASDLPQTLLVVVAVAAAAAAMWLTSARLSDDRTQIRELVQRVKDLETVDRATTRDQQFTTVSSGDRRFGPTPRNKRLESLEQARQKVAAARERYLEVDSPHQAPRAEPRVTQAESDGPLVTIAVALSNDANLVEATIESIRHQHFASWECYIVDDASVDSSVASAMRFASIDKRLRVVRHKTAGGSGAAWNSALRLSGGRYFLPLRVGERLDETALLELVEAAAVAATTESAGSCTLTEGAPHPSDHAIDFLSGADLIGRSGLWALVDRAVLIAAGGFDERRSAGERYAAWIALLRSGYVLEAAPSGLVRSLPGGSSPQRIAALQRIMQSTAASADSSGSPGYPFPQPLGDYRLALNLAELAIRSAVSEAVRPDGDIGAALASLAPGSASFIERHTDVVGLIDSELELALGLGGNAAALSKELEPIRRHVLAQFENAVGGEVSVVPAPSQGIDVLFLPQDAHQATIMAKLRGSLPDGTTSGFVVCDRIDGNQGTEGALATAGVESLSANEWFLNDIAPRKVVVAYPRSATIDGICAAAAEGGVAIAEISQPTDSILHVDSASPLEVDAVSVGVDNFANWLRNGAQPIQIDSSQPNRGRRMVGSRRIDSAHLNEEEPQLVVDSEDLARFHDKHRGQRCIIIGNGPSLNDLDLSKMAGENTIGVNGIFYAAEEMGFDLTYYVVEDTMVVKDNLEAIKAYRAGHKFFPSIYRNLIGEQPGATYFNMNQGFYLGNSPSHCVPRFSVDAAQRVFSGQSVTVINLQLAYYLGFSEVILIGMDFSYSIPDDAKIDGNHITSMSDDPNHFHPDYFGKGKVWKDPKLDRVLASYQQAKLMFEADGRRIVNATAGGKLELFDRVPYDSLFD